jgi:hypothetical protein
VSGCALPTNDELPAALYSLKEQARAVEGTGRIIGQKGFAAQRISLRRRRDLLL